MAGGNRDFPPALRDFVIDNIQIGKQIGRGANGRILEAEWEGIVVAVKEIHSIFMNEVSDLEFQSFKRSFLRECEQSSRLRHPNIVRFLGVYYPPGARVPSLVMERLQCSLNNLIETNPVVPTGTKLFIIKDVALGLRYLHTRDPPIIHRDLSSNNVLLSKGMEGKIGDLGTARLVDSRKQSRMTKAPGTVDFMPPEALEDITNIHYGKELDVFSFGCVMLHTLSHQWPTPVQAAIINPDTGLVMGGRSEVERRSKYFEKIDRNMSGVLIPLIEGCLSNLPKNRTSIVRLCDQLDNKLIDSERVSINELGMFVLKQEIQQKDAELQRKNIEIQQNYSEIQMKDHEIQRKDHEIQRKDHEIQMKDREIQRKNAEIHRLSLALHDKDVTADYETLKIDVSVPQTITRIAESSCTTSELRKAKSHRSRVFIPGLHSPYITLPSGHNRNLFTVIVMERAESAYALTLDPKMNDIWLPDVSSVNRSFRGDTVAIDLLSSNINKGTVITNLSSISYNHPKEYFVCHIDRHTYNLLVPFNKQYPKIDSCQNVEVNGLSIFADRLCNSFTCYNIKFEDVGKYVYLVRLNLPWTESHVYPKGVPVKHIKWEGDMTFLNILKFNYIPAMPINDGKFLPHILTQAMQQFPIDWEIPHKERRKRKIHENVFTIDDEGTVVLDDALSLEYDQDKNYIVNVHIADASYFVTPGTALDRTASERGRTFYIHYEDDGAMFMLPDNICMNHGSLNPGKERLAVTTQFLFSKKDYSLLSQLSDIEVHRSIVCSLCRLTKEDAGKLLLENSMQHPGNMTATQFSKLKKDVSIMGKIATELRKSQWPGSYLYKPDRSKCDNKYTMAGSSLVEIFMCLCNIAIPTKLLKRDGGVGPVIVHEPIKHHKQLEWLKHHHHLLKYCPVFKRMISDEAITSFSIQNQCFADQTDDSDDFLMVSKESWDKICNLAEKHDSGDLATFLCSLQYFPELYVAYRQLYMSQSKSFYHVINTNNVAESWKYQHSHFGKIYTHFTSPLRRYCDILVHRAILGGRNPSLPSMEVIHKMNIHKWDEREFSKQRNMLYLVDCCRRKIGAVAVTAYVGKVTSKVIELHVLPELQEILPDQICELKMCHLQTKCDAENMHLLKWNLEIIPAPNNRSSRKVKDIEEDYNLVKIPFATLGMVIKDLHEANFNEAKRLIKTCRKECWKCRDVDQQVKPSCNKLTITKNIREYNKLDIQLTSNQTKSYSMEPTISLVRISQTFFCCVLHVKSPIQCYVPNISKFTPRWSPTAHNISYYVDLWQPAIEAESVCNSTSCSRVPLIIKDLKLKWVSPREAHFSANNNYRIKYQRPFGFGDYVCIQYHGLLPNPKSQYTELDGSKKVTWVAHGKIVSDDDAEDVKIIFPENTTLPETPLSDKLCYLEVIPIQLTFRYV